MPEQFPHSPQGQERRPYSRIEGDLHDEPDTQEQPIFSKLDTNQEPLDVDILDEEKFGPSKALEHHSGETREPGIYDAEIITDEGMATLLKKREKEDAGIARKYDESESARKEKARREATMTVGSFVASRLAEDILSSGRRTSDRTAQPSATEREQAERLALTMASLETALTFLPKYDVSRMKFERILRGRGTSTELANLNKVRATLTKKYLRALENGEEFTPEMAMNFYEDKYQKNNRTVDDSYDYELSDRYYAVKNLFSANPNALKAFMGLSAEEINKAA